jgi:transposase
MGRPQIKLKLQHTPEELQQHYQQARSAVERRRSQVIWFLSLGKTSLETAELTAYSHVSILDTIHKYNQAGLEGLKDHRVNNRGAPTVLSDQEMLLLAQSIRSDFEQGIIWRGKDVLQWVKRVCNKELHQPRAYELLAAIGFTLQVPRPSHELSNLARIEDFKKKSLLRQFKQPNTIAKKLKSGQVMSIESV